MSRPFYFDEHVHAVIAKGLRARGIDVLTVQEDGLAGSPDRVVFKRAQELNRILVSNDEDMLAIAAEDLRKGAAFHGLLFLIRAPLRQHIESLELIALLAGEEETAGKVWFLPL